MSDSHQATPAYLTPPSGSVPGSEIVPRGRGCVSSVASNGCGCLAFLLGSALAVAFFGAHLLSGWGARAIEQYIGQHIDGTVEVSGVELSWSKPQSASSVSIKSPDGDLVIQARLTLPSLFDLIGEPEGERTVRIVLSSLQAQIDADETSDLGRTFRLGADDGRTVVEAVYDRVVDFLSTRTDDVTSDSLRVELVIERASFDERAGGRADVKFEDLTLVASVNRIGAQIDLRECVLRVDGMEGVQEVGFDTRFVYGADGRLRLTSASFNADAIPRSVLRTLGVVPRAVPRLAQPNSVPGRDIYDVFGEQVRRATTAFLEDGAAINVTFGPTNDGEALVEPGAESGAPTSRLSLSMKNAVGEIKFDADWRNGAFVPARLEEGGYALWMEFALPRHGPASVLQAIMPQGVTVDDHEPGLPWRLASNSFRLPVDESVLSVGGVEDLNGVARADGLGPWLRTVDAELTLLHSGDVPSKVRFEPRKSLSRPGDQLDWTHRLTTLSLTGELGGSLESHWKADQGDRSYARVTLSLPGRSLGPSDAPRALVDATIPGLPLALLEASARIPVELRTLLPRRLHRLELRGIPVSRFMTPRREDRSSVGVDVSTTPEVLFRGQFQDGTFRMPSAHFPLVVTRDVCDALLLRLMPWLSAIEPLEEGAMLSMNLRDYEFRVNSGPFQEAGAAEIELPPMRIKLKDDLAQYFDLKGAEDSGGWIEWTPAPIELLLEPDVTRYRSVELPLGDDVEPSVMTGKFDRKDNTLSLRGFVDARSLSSQDDGVTGPEVAGGDGQGKEDEVVRGGGFLPVEVAIDGPPDRLRVFFNQRFIKRTLTDLVDRFNSGG